MRHEAAIERNATLLEDVGVGVAVAALAGAVIIAIGLWFHYVSGAIFILGTALIDTGSRMDEVIFEEFKGTGNMELHLDRGLSDKRIFPAINIDRSGTRKEELIYHPDEMTRVYGLRRAMQGIPPVEAMEMFITRLKKTKTNAEFLMSLR